LEQVYVRARCARRFGKKDQMKEATESTMLERSPEPETFGNRKLIRPTLPRNEHTRSSEPAGERRERAERPERALNSKKTPPPDQTHAENFYYQKQMQGRTPMVVVLQDGEQIQGIIEWYDKSCIKLTRSSGHANLLIYKSCIKYIYKESEGNGRR
jgi:host factor-I protein